MQQLFQWLLGAGKETALIIISMLPGVELRGAIPLGLATGMRWGELLPLCYFGNIVFVPFAILLGEHVLKFLERLPLLDRYSRWYQAKLYTKSEQVTRYAHWGLLIFVAIPLPGTGAWSGSLIAALLRMRFAKAFFSIAGGVIIAGLIMALGSSAVISAFGLL